MKTRLLVWTLLVVAPSAVAAQGRVAVALSGSAAFLQLRHTAAGQTERLRGLAFGAEGRGFAGPVFLELAYQEGTLRPLGDGSAKSDLVEGRILAGVRPVPWLDIAAGPHVRAYVTNADTERWLFWEARIRLERPLIGRVVAARLELWQVFSAAVSVSAPFNRAGGGEAGVTFGLHRSMWARLTYRFDHSRLGGGSVSETLEGFYFLIGLGRR